ncbi:MAG: hypothetical protein ACM3W7_05000 [Acidobacteriota bacterium]|jgi:hypothetical protein
MEIASTGAHRKESNRAVNPKARTSGADNDSKSKDEAALQSHPLPSASDQAHVVNKIV